MSGRRPDTTKVWNFIGSFRDPAIGGDKWRTLPQYFKEYGFTTCLARTPVTVNGGDGMTVF